MLVFKGKKTYEDYVRTIGNGMTSNTFEFKCGMEHERGFDYLMKIVDEDKQKKIIDTLNVIDKDMDSSSKDNEMYRKISYFLKAGIIFEEYDEYLTDLSPEAISTLLIDNTFSMNDKNTRKYISILANNDMLLFLRDNYNDGERDDIMLAITEHYDNSPFDTYSSREVLQFQKNELKRLQKDKKEFLSDVKSYTDIGEEVMTELYGGKK